MPAVTIGANLMTQTRSWTSSAEYRAPEGRKRTGSRDEEAPRKSLQFLSPGRSSTNVVGDLDCNILMHE